MADPSFFVKVGIECGIGIGTKCAAESKKRGDAFKQELDFVTANVIMAIIADFMLVWLPAPTMSFASANSCRAPANAVARFFSCCPENAFQKVPAGAPQIAVSVFAVSFCLLRGHACLCRSLAARGTSTPISSLRCWPPAPLAWSGLFVRCARAVPHTYVRTAAGIVL